MADKNESAGSKLIKDIAKQQNAMEGHFGQISRQQRELAKAAADEAKQTEKAAKAQEKRDEQKKLAAEQQHQNLVMKVSGLNMTQLAQQKTDETALSERKAQLDALKKSMKDMGLSIEGNKKIAKEEGKIAKAEIKLQTQNKSTLSKLVGFLTPGGPGDKEKANEANRKHKGLMGMFGDMKKGIVGMGGKLGGLAKGLGGMAAGGAKGLLGMLKKGALFLAIPALIAFMQSPMFEDLKKWVVDEMIPALGRMVDAIKPVATAVVNWIKDSFLPITISALVQGFKDLSTFFSDVFARFSGWSDMTLREKIGAVLGIFTNITELVGKLVGNMIEAVANLFGADGATIRKKYWDPIAKFFTDIVDSVMLIFTDPVAGIKKLFATLWDATKGIGGFIFDITIKPAWNWIKGLFGFGEKDKPKDADSTKGVIGFLTDLVVGVWEWFKGLFDFSSVGAGFASIINLITLPHQIIFELVMGVWKWFKGLFGFETKDTETAGAQTKPGGLGGVLLSLVTGVWEWFKGLFSWGKVVLAKGADEVKGVVGFLTDLAVGVWEWFKGLFDFSSVGAGFASIVNLITLPHQIIFELVMGVWKWFKGLFGFDTKDTEAAGAQTKPGGLGGILLDMVTGVWKWIKGLFGFSSEDADKDPRSGSDNVLDFIIAIPGKIWSWLKKTVLGWFGLARAEDTIVAEVADAEKPEPGWISKLFSAIFPDWLLNPVKWIKTKLGMLDKEGNKTDPAALVESGEGGIGAMIGAIFNNIFPEWIRSPITWIKKKLGLVDDEGKLTDKAKDVVEASKGGIGAMINALFGDIFPEWITSPIVWIKKKLGLTGDDAAKKDTWKFPGFPSISDIKEFLPKWLTDPVGWIKSWFGGDDDEKSIGKSEGRPARKTQALDPETAQRVKTLKAMLAAQTALGLEADQAKIDKITARLNELTSRAKGGPLGAGVLSIVGERGPELFMSKGPGTVIPNEGIQTIAKGLDFMKNAALMGATKSSATTNQAPILVNNITNAPVTNSSQSNTKINTAIGSSDPFTHVAVAY